MAPSNRKFLMQSPADAAKWEALEVLANDPTNFYRTELDTAGAEKYRNEGGFEIVPSQRFNEELGAVSEAVRKKREPVPQGHTGSEMLAGTVARYNEAMGRPGMGPETIAGMAQDERALAGYREPGFRRPTPEMLADAESGVANFEQGLRLKGQSGTGAGRAAAPARPSIAVGRPGAAGAPRPVEPLRAPSQPTTELEAVAARETQPPAGDEEFAAAQERARGNRLGASIGRAGETIAAGISGRQADGSFYDGLEQDADLPVTELLARREANKRKALQDHTSEPSRRLQQAVAKAMPGVYSPEELAQLTAEDERMVTQYGAMRQRLEERKLDLSRQDEQRAAAIAREDAVRADERAWQARQAAAGRAFTAGENAKNRAADIAEARARNTASAQTAQKLPAGEAAALGEAEAAVQSLKDLGAAYDTDIASGFGSSLTGLTQYLPGTDATLYEDKMRATAQSVGTFLEGGKLAAGDEVKYLRMLPSPGDGAERKKGKIDNLNRLIATKRQEKINALKAAGFNLGNLGAGSSSPAKTIVDRIKMPDGKTVTLYSDGSEETT